uniref:Senataxin n=1 Tax=Latimeria chalumnae TaxID=7897 RepID=H3BFG1_LATCH
QDSGWKNAICPEYCPNMYEEMQTLVNVLQSDIGQDMRVHNSTFLWFIPFVQSVMDLKDLGIVYIGEVIHHLYSEIKDVLNRKVSDCDKVAEFFILILVSIIELHRSKNCLHLLWFSSQKWVEAIVKSSKLPAKVFSRGTEKSSGSGPVVTSSSSSMSPQVTSSVQHSCIQLIRSFLREGCQLGHQTTCKQFLDRLNMQLRKGFIMGWQLSPSETQDLQACLKQIIKSVKDKTSAPNLPDKREICQGFPTAFIKQEKQDAGEYGKMGLHWKSDPYPPCPSLPCSSEIMADVNYQGNPPCRAPKDSCGPEPSIDSKIQSCAKSSSCTKLQCLTNEKEIVDQKPSPKEITVISAPLTKDSTGQNQQASACSETNGIQGRCVLTGDAASDFSRGCDTDSHDFSKPATPTHKNLKIDPHRLMNLKSKVNMTAFQSKLLKVIESTSKKNKENEKKLGGGGSVQSDGATSKYFLPRADSTKDKTVDDDVRIQSPPSTFVSNLVEKEKPESEGLSAIPCSMRKEPTDESFETTDPDKSGSDTDDDLPLTVVRQNLKCTASVQNIAMGSMTDSQVDRDLNHFSLAAFAKVVNFPVDSSQEPSQLPLESIQRKVKSGVRPSKIGQELPSDNEGPDNNQVIVISDSDSSKEETESKINVKTIVKQEKSIDLREYPQKQTSAASSSIQGSQEQKVKQEDETSPPVYDSQFFEFETEDDVYSEWQDSQIKNNDGDDNMQDMINDWGYDTDFISDDVIEKMAEEAEALLKSKEVLGVAFGSKHSTKKKSDAQAGPLSSSKKQRAHTVDSRSKSDLKLGRISKNDVKLKDPKATRSKPLQKATDKKRSKKSRLLTASAEVSSVVPSSSRMITDQNKILSPMTRATPAIVPPRKNRKEPAPTSRVERLGLEKRARKASELSQHSLDYVAELRSHGRSVGKVQNNRKLKTKLISPQKLTVNRNRRLLACQEAQFFRQSRPKRSKNANNSSEGANRNRPPKTTERGILQNDIVGSIISAGISCNKAAEEAKVKPISSSNFKDNQQKKDTPAKEQEKFYFTYESISDDDDNALPLTQPHFLVSPLKTREDAVSIPTGNVPSIDTRPTSLIDKKEKLESHQVTENVEDDVDDDLYLTQLDPVDMEMCSQMENFEDTAICTQMDVVDMEIDTGSDGPVDKTISVNCKHANCSEVVTLPGGFCPRHTASRSNADFPFLKPGLPPSVLKPTRPSTTKIFTIGTTSRNAQLTKELEAPPKIHTVPSKSRSNMPKPLIPGSAIPSSVRGQVESPRPPDSTHILQAHSSDKNNKWAPQPCVGTESPRAPPVQVNLSPSQQLDQLFLIKEILKWNYEMFTNISQFGAPDDLSRMPLKQVPDCFKSYDDYFAAFYPLMILNSFEVLAQDWLENQKENYKALILKSSKASMTKFFKSIASIRNSDLAKQHHPKEDDLVFLWLPPCRNGYTAEEGELDGQLIPYLGHVSRFNRTSVESTRGSNEPHTTVYLTIRTQGNVSALLQQHVKCEVIGSLVTTLRQFKALQLLYRSQLARPILSPRPSFFSTEALVHRANWNNAFFINNEFNKDQERAINTAFAMVKEQPRQPKICLIQGPPGTGKSKTIVGLLERILIEKQENLPPAQNLTVKNKRNRVLLCAPSNAAIDDLMKKIIITFKGKCRDKNYPLGNCGDINLVRLGAERVISADVQKFSLDYQVKHKINKAQVGSEQDIWRRDKLDQELNELSHQCAMHRNEPEQHRTLMEKKNELMKLREQLGRQVREARGRNQEIQRNIILESHIICCTLSTSGSILLECAFRRLGHDPFICVIVDEAGQACEPEILIPLIYRCPKLVLVGDPMQLPPIIKSMKAQDLKYGQSMMWRLFKNLHKEVKQKSGGQVPVLKLTIQYRMHPDICLFPSRYIYNKALTTDIHTEEKRVSSAWLFQPYLLFDVTDGSESRSSGSYFNQQEVKLVMALIKMMADKRDGMCRDIGVITPYSAQKRKLVQQLEGFTPARSVEVDTVDGFQGREKDCIIVSCVRANVMQGSIGFLANRQRLNVTITRARFSLFILGHLKTLMDNKDWNELIQDAQRRGAIIKTCEKEYKRDVTRIVKRKPVMQRNLTYPSNFPSEADLWLSTVPASKMDQQTELQASDSSKTSGSVPTSVTATTSTKMAATVHERPRDPRLLRRAEAAVK